MYQNRAKRQHRCAQMWKKESFTEEWESEGEINMKSYYSLQAVHKWYQMQTIMLTPTH